MCAEWAAEEEHKALLEAVAETQERVLKEMF